MIFPTKHILPGHSLFDAGSTLLAALVIPSTVSDLWQRVREDMSVQEFERFVLALDLLYVLNAVQYRNGVLHRSRL